MGSYKMFLCFRRSFKENEKEAPADVKDAFAMFTDGWGQMSPEQLLRFLIGHQGEALSTLADAQAIVEGIRHHRHLASFTRPLLTLDDFHHFLFSPLHNPPIPSSQVHQDMTAPLSHYYIYTGHNSYLTGNQLSSDSSDVPIIKALNEGVRVIELDIWPNSTKDDVDVLHGRTLTAPVQLIKCLRSIKEHAFVASPYPVVITLEDHLTTDLQAKVAEMVTQTFGDMLFYPPAEYLGEFPSPEELKNRILISTKPPKEYLESKTFKGSSSRREKDSFDDEEWGKEVPYLKVEEAADKRESDTDEPSQYESDVDDGDHKLHQSTETQYESIIAIRAGKPKGGIKSALKVEEGVVKRLSLSEQALEKAAISHGTDLVRFTQKNFLRVYPKGTRFDSSNYNPLIGWAHGAQMVAFNMQGHGRSLWLMQGFFRANGGCGYVKKPDFLMECQNNEVFNPTEKREVKKTLKVKLYMGNGWRLDFDKTHFDTFSPPDFYARVGIAGVPADAVMNETSTVEDDWAPVWGEEFIFPLTVPELALLRIEVHEHDMSQKDDFAGQTCLPVSELRPGIRAVPLFNRKGEMFESVKLLMRFEFV